jgi:hypothetical protein
MIGELLGEDQRVGEISMHPERDDLAAAAEYICVRLYPQELRAAYVSDVRGRYAWGDVPWEGLITLALQELSIGMTALFIDLLGHSLYDKSKKPDSNVERLLHEERAARDALLNGQRLILARLDALIGEAPEKQAETARLTQQFSDPTTAARVNEALQKQIDRARAGRQFHESMILKIQDSDPEITAMAEDAIRQLEARGAKALVDDVHAAGNWSGNWSAAVRAEDAPLMRWWHRPD